MQIYDDVALEKSEYFQKTKDELSEFFKYYSCLCSRAEANAFMQHYGCSKEAKELNWLSNYSQVNGNSTRDLLAPMLFKEDFEHLFCQKDWFILDNDWVWAALLQGRSFEDVDAIRFHVTKELNIGLMIKIASNRNAFLYPPIKFLMRFNGLNPEEHKDEMDHLMLLIELLRDDYSLEPVPKNLTISELYEIACGGLKESEKKLMMDTVMKKTNSVPILKQIVEHLTEE